MIYRVFVSIPVVLEVDASSEEDAEQQVLNSLIAQKQIKPADYVEIKVARDA